MDGRVEVGMVERLIRKNGGPPPVETPSRPWRPALRRDPRHRSGQEGLAQKSGLEHRGQADDVPDRRGREVGCRPHAPGAGASPSVRKLAHVR